MLALLAVCAKAVDIAIQSLGPVDRDRSLWNAVLELLLWAACIAAIWLVAFGWIFVVKFRKEYRRRHALDVHQRALHMLIADGLRVRAELLAAALASSDADLNKVIPSVQRWRQRYRDLAVIPPCLPGEAAVKPSPLAPQTPMDSARDWVPLIDSMCTEIAGLLHAIDEQEKARDAARTRRAA